MPYKTRYGTHYHETYGCCGATEACDTKGLEPCSICCGDGAGGDGGMGPGDGSTSGAGVTSEQARGVPSYAQGPREKEAEADDEPREERPKPTEILTQDDFEEARRGELGRSVETVEAGRKPGVAPTPEEEEILSRIASLEAELADLRAQQAAEELRAEIEAAGDAAPDADDLAAAQAALDADINANIDRVFDGVALSSDERRRAYDGEVGEGLALMQWEVMTGFGLKEGQELTERQEQRVLDLLTTRMEEEGYGDKINDAVLGVLGESGSDLAIKACGRFADQGGQQSHARPIVPHAAVDGEFGDAQDSRDKGIRDYIEHFYGEMNLTDQGKQALYDESVSDSLSSLEWDVQQEMGFAGRVPSDRDKAAMVAELADRIEAQGYGDKLTKNVKRNLESDGDDLARRACDVVDARRQRRQDAYDYQLASRISEIQGEVMEEMGLRGIRARDRERVADAIAQRMEQEGLVDQLTDGIGWRLTDMNAHTAGLAVDRIRGRRSGGGEGNPQEQRLQQSQQAQSRQQQAKPASSPKPKRASRRRKPKDPMEGMSASEERAAFDKEFNTRETDGYMGSRGYKGSKSGQNLYGKELTGAVRSDLKRWLGHLGVPKGDVRVRMHRYSGGMSMDIETRLDKSRHAASENQFKDAYRRLFWQVTPRWGTVQTSRGPVDVSRLTDHSVDQGALMDDIIDTAWRNFQANGANVDTGNTRVSGNPWHEIYLNDEGREVARRTQAVVDSYNYDESNGMVDYFNSGFYSSSHVVLE